MQLWFQAERTTGRSEWLITGGNQAQSLGFVCANLPALTPALPFPLRTPTPPPQRVTQAPPTTPSNHKPLRQSGHGSAGQPPGSL